MIQKYKRTSIIPIMILRLTSRTSKHFFLGRKKSDDGKTQGRIGFERANYNVGLAYQNYIRNKDNPVNSWLLWRVEQDILKGQRIIENIHGQLDGKKQRRGLTVKRIKGADNAEFTVNVRIQHHTQALRLLLDFDDVMVRINGYHISGILTEDEVFYCRRTAIRTVKRYIGFAARIKFKSGDELETLWPIVLPMRAEEYGAWLKSRKKKEKEDVQIFLKKFSDRFDGLPTEDFIRTENRTAPQWVSSGSDEERYDEIEATDLEEALDASGEKKKQKK